MEHSKHELKRKKKHFVLPKKNFHITPLPPHNGHFLLSPRRPLWRGSVVSLKGGGGGITGTPRSPASHTPVMAYTGMLYPKGLPFSGLGYIKKVGSLLAKRDVVLQTRHVEGVPFIEKRYTKGIHNWCTVG